MRPSPHDPTTALTRRALLQRGGQGVGALALAHLLDRESGARGPHFAPRAKRVIHLHMIGAPSHLDLFAPKPELQKRTGETCPDEFFLGKKLAFIREQPTLLGTPDEPRFRFQRCGESGLPISNLLPHLQTCADRLAVVHTVRTEEFNHAPAQMFLHTGFARFGRPSLGAWLDYGLGSPNENLPGYVVLVTGQYPGAGNSIFGSGFLPSIHQGVEFRSQGDPVLFLSDPPGVSRDDRRRIVDSIRALGEEHFDDFGDPETETRIRQYELAFRMQASVPELTDMSDEPAHVLEMYGATPGDGSFASNCLLARRLAERDVRFIQVYHRGWDHHGAVQRSMEITAEEVDRASAALILDLEQRGLLEDTLVLWGGEFGRTPMGQGSGRDHHILGFSYALAGAGIPGGVAHGATDELGYRAVDGITHVRDLHATILHLLGLDHRTLDFDFRGLKQRLTGVEEARVLHDVIG